MEGLSLRGGGPLLQVAQRRPSIPLGGSYPLSWSHSRFQLLIVGQLKFDVGIGHCGQCLCCLLLVLCHCITKSSHVGSLVGFHVVIVIL